MRRIVRSRTYFAQLRTLLEHGSAVFGTAVAERTLARIDHVIERHLAQFPRKPVDRQLGLSVFSILRTPFVLIYDFDDSELRVHFIVPMRQDRKRIDPKSVEW